MFVCFFLPLYLFSVCYFLSPPELTAAVTEHTDGCTLFNSCPAQPSTPPGHVQAELQSHTCADALGVNGTTPERLFLTKARLGRAARELLL